MRAQAAMAIALLAALPVAGPFAQAVAGGGGAESLETASGSTVTVEGDPASDDAVTIRARGEGRQASVRVSEAPGDELGAAPVGGPVQDASPTGPAEARMELAAGPQVLDGPGRISPVFPLLVRVSTDDEAIVDRAWLLVDGAEAVALEEAGREGDRRVFLGELSAGALRPGEVRLGSVFERQPAPGVTHRVRGPAWTVQVDAAGPDPPELEVTDEGVLLVGAGERFEAQSRPANGSWRPADVDDDRVPVPAEAGPQWVRARGVDEAGNRGPWSPPTPVGNASGTETRPSQDWRLVAPEDGSTVAGAVEVVWRPADDGPLVEVDARQAPGEAWRTVERSSTPPIEWPTRFVTDGDWQLRIRADEPDGWTTRLVDVTVDNLEEVSTPAGDQDRSRAAVADPRERSPWPRVLASSVALVALAGGAWQARDERAK